MATKLTHSIIQALSPWTITTIDTLRTYK